MPTFEGLLDSETGLTCYGRTSASAAIRQQRPVELQCDGYLSLSREHAQAATSPSRERGLMTRSVHAEQATAPTMSAGSTQGAALWAVPSISDANRAEDLAQLNSSSAPVTHVNESVECSQELLRHRQGHGLLPLAEALNQPR